MPPKIELMNGVSEEGLRELVEQGYTTEVVCVDDPEYTGQNFTGKWNIRAVSPDGDDEMVLVTQRQTKQPRDIRTIIGVINLLCSLGYEGVTLPMRAGGRRANRKRGSNQALD